MALYYLQLIEEVNFLDCPEVAFPSVIPPAAEDLRVGAITSHMRFRLAITSLSKINE
jgi:hypothetical protein